MSGILQLVEDKEDVTKSIQRLTFKAPIIFDQCNRLLVSYCHHILEEQTEKLMQMNEALLQQQIRKAEEEKSKNKQ